ncbi:DEAD/DEAH box helicase [Clostridium sp.]|uniref:DEAD/DEAH box helicase n=1 Tax=Clostridium sp. TaxID=1506 RepID=UPI0026050A7B|nr:DEAD/DEAH box helicase [Clostridium sp.]
MDSFNMLSEKMKNKIWDMEWNEFTDIQNKSIPKIINTIKDIIISSSTASGKTEAAFLPILTLVEKTARTSIKAIYVSPLKALINNQFNRIENFLSSLDINVHKWHGDVSSSRKSKILKEGTGILQITPESLESLFINKTNYLGRLFKDVDFIIIDEIHAFLNNARGVQLRSLISRIEEYSLNKIRIIGLSATISNYDFIKRWVRYDDIENVEIIEESKSNKALNYSLMHFENGKDFKMPMEFYEDIRELTRNMKAIIFCNSRGEVEEMTVMLNRLAIREGIEETYYPHHSSIDKSEREFVEKKMLESDTPRTIISTSSLELGIDIGDLELVIQVDTTNTVSSLKQRLGRSGRKKGEEQYLQLYTSSNESLIQSIAVMELQLEKWVEPSEGYKASYDILFHQILSICCEKNGITKEELLDKIELNKIFNSLKLENIIKLIDYMIESDYLECIHGSFEVIVGLTGEKILRSKEFYGVFMTPIEYEVINVHKKIGKLEKNVSMTPGSNVILAGKLWTIEEINDSKKNIYVSKAANAKRPIFRGGLIKFHKVIGYKMMEILCDDKKIDYIDEKAKDILEDMRMSYKIVMANKGQRIIWQQEDKMVFATFTGTEIYRTIAWMLRVVGVEVVRIDIIGNIIIRKDNIIEKIEEMKNKKWSVKEIFKITRENELFVSKYSEYLPEDLRILMHIEQEINLEGAIDYLKEFKFILR